MMNFVYQENKRKSGAAAGFCDDTAIALMLAYHGAKLYPCIAPGHEQKKEIKKSNDPDTQRAWRLFNEKIRGSRRKKVLL